MNKADKDKVIAALEMAGAAKLADGTYLDKDCSITMAITIMRGLEDAEPETAMVDAAMVAMKGIYPPLRRSECQQLIRAAFNATSPQAAQTERPPYPEGDVVGPCVCGSWPGGKCLRCEWIPAQTEAQEREALFSEWFDSTPHGEPSPRETFNAGYQAGRAGRKG